MKILREKENFRELRLSKYSREFNFANLGKTHEILSFIFLGFCDENINFKRFTRNRIPSPINQCNGVLLSWSPLHITMRRVPAEVGPSVNEVAKDVCYQ